MSSSWVLVQECDTSYHTTQRPQNSSFLGLPYRILYMNPKKELLWGLWVEINANQIIPLVVTEPYKLP